MQSDYDEKEKVSKRFLKILKLYQYIYWYLYA